MNKQDKIIVALLFALLVAWFLTQKSKSQPQVPAKAAATQARDTSPADVPDKPDQPEVISTPEKVTEESPAASHDEEAVVSEEPVEHTTEEHLLTLVNSNIEITVSSWGACVKDVKLLDYREQVDTNSPPVNLDFSKAPVLAISGVNKWSTAGDFSVVASSSREVVFESRNDDVTFRRTIAVGDGYKLDVADEFSSAKGSGGIVPAYAIEAGSMTKVKSKSSSRGVTYISIDSAPVGEDPDVVHWSKTKSVALDGEGASKMRLAQRLQPEGRQGGCGMFKPKLTEMLPESTDLEVNERVQWVAVKNKFFLSVLTPLDGGTGLKMHIRRKLRDRETPENPRSWASAASIEEVSAQMLFDPSVISDGTNFVRNYTCYIGPKKYSELKKLGDAYGEIMQFGFWTPLSRILLTTLNAIYGVFNSYGVAIILLTIVVRLIFWPITHKSTESMKRMQTIQPEIKKIQEKYKDNPTKLNKATMALYKEHKVNPMAGCLPLFIQIPVFFALFRVLRSAVELRFAEFLWIKDLSEQEGLFAGVLPIPLNILPLVMTVLTLFQQRLTPSAGDPKQQKMMMFMPVMFLFLFYPMPSALVLYWTTSQFIALIQLLLQRRKKKDAVATA